MSKTKTTADVSHVRELERRKKTELIAAIKQWGRDHGRRWVVGGPEEWTKMELVSAVLRIERGQEP